MNRFGRPDFLRTVITFVLGMRLLKISLELIKAMHFRTFLSISFLFAGHKEIMLLGTICCHRGVQKVKSFRLVYKKFLGTTIKSPTSSTHNLGVNSLATVSIPSCSRNLALTTSGSAKFHGLKIVGQS